jgi:phospholipid transport system substrate-binding protein
MTTLALPRRTLLVALALALSAPAGALAGKRPKGEHEKVIGKLINGVRASQDLAAVAYIDGEATAKELLGASWETGGAADRAEFVRLFHHLFASIAFPRIRESFRHLTSITHGASEAKGDEVEVTSVIHVQVGPAEQEVKARFRLRRGGDGKLRIVDVTLAGDRSMLTGIRDDQVAPILAEGGWAKLLELLRARVKSLPPLVNAPLTKRG